MRNLSIYIEKLYKNNNNNQISNKIIQKKMFLLPDSKVEILIIVCQNTETT